MDDLVRWLTACLDEDERIARAVEDRSAPWDGQWMADGNSAVRTVNGHVLFYRHGPDPLKPGLADHVAEHDPARVLREIEAKRRVIAEVVPEIDLMEDRIDGEWGVGASNLAERESRLLLRLLALPYSDRPGYAEATASVE